MDWPKFSGFSVMAAQVIISYTVYVIMQLVKYIFD